MRDRSDQLDAVTYGSKEMLWARLSRLESELKPKGGPGIEPRMSPIPKAPDKRHELDHYPLVDWCPACVLGQTVERFHRQIAEEVALATASGRTCFLFHEM